MWEEERKSRSSCLNLFKAIRSDSAWEWEMAQLLSSDVGFNSQVRPLDRVLLDLEEKVWKSHGRWGAWVIHDRRLPVQRGQACFRSREGLRLDPSHWLILWRYRVHQAREEASVRPSDIPFGIWGHWDLQASDSRDCSTSGLWDIHQASHDWLEMMLIEYAKLN